MDLLEGILDGLAVAQAVPRDGNMPHFFYIAIAISPPDDIRFQPLTRWCLKLGQLFGCFAVEGQLQDTMDKRVTS